MTIQLILLCGTFLTQLPTDRGEATPSRGVRSHESATGSALEKFTELYAERSQIKTIILNFDIIYNICSVQPEFEGTHRQFQLWAGFEADGKFRLDYQDVVSKDEKKKLYFKYAKLNNLHKIIRQIDRPDVMVEEITPEYEQRTKKVEAQLISFDPRLLGVFPAPAESMRNYSLDVLRTLKPSDSKIGRSNDNVANKNPNIIYCDTPSGGTINYTFEPNFRLPVSIEVDGVSPDGKEHMRTISIIKIGKFENKLGGQIEFPQVVKFTSWKNEKKEFEETLTVTSATFNDSIDDSLFTWKALKPDRGAELLRNENYTDLRGWDGNDFTVIRDKSVPRAPTKSKTRSVSYLMLTIGMPLLILAVALIIKGRGSKTEAN